LRTIDVQNDGSILIYITQEGSGACVDFEDTVFYKHETRFDNG